MRPDSCTSTCTCHVHVHALAVLAIVVALTRVARADLIKPPAGWQADPSAATGLATKANKMPHFGGLPALATTEVYIAPAPTVALFVTAVAGRTDKEREQAARVAVDELHATSQRAALAGSGIVEDAWQEKADPGAKQIEASLAWRDTAAGTATSARLLVVADADHVVAVTGECVAGEGADAKAVAACKAALATLDPGIAADKRVALALAPPGARPAPTVSEPPGPAPHTPLAPITVREDRSPDRRPVYVGAGLIVLAALFWWNRRRRAKP